MEPWKPPGLAEGQPCLHALSSGLSETKLALRRIAETDCAQMNTAGLWFTNHSRLRITTAVHDTPHVPANPFMLSWPHGMMWNLIKWIWSLLPGQPRERERECLDSVTSAFGDCACRATGKSENGFVAVILGCCCPAMAGNPEQMIWALRVYNTQYFISGLMYPPGKPQKA